MPFTIEEATPDHAADISKILLDNETDEFLKLQFGTVDPAIMSQGLTERFAESIKTSGQVYVIARDEDSKEVASYSSWTLPRGEDEEYVKHSDEEKAAATEAYRAKLIDGMNVPLVMDFRQQINDMRERVLGDRRHYMLGNLGSLPAYRGRGAGTALTSWPFERADSEGVLVYLDTDELGDAKRMYDRLGFKKVDEEIFDLSKYGGGRGVHTHIGMIREPRTRTST